MWMKKFTSLMIGFVVLCVVLVPTISAQDGTAYRWVEVVNGLSRPLYATNSGDGSNRLFVLEQTGRIWVVEEGQLQTAPFLDLAPIISQEPMNPANYSERGLLGLDFHPNYAENGQFFVHYSDLNGDTVIARYSVSADDPNVADPNSGEIILTQTQPYPNHNGGQIEFGPDGYLYIGLGDGGSQADPQNNAQNPNTLLGKILRIDVDGGEPYSNPADNPYASGGGLPEIWALGFRNPWRFSFDRETGDLYIADVGQFAWEEISFVPADSPGGLNFGWKGYEATHVFDPNISLPADAVLPIAEYGHNEGCSVSGGYVYRGESLPELQGTYLFGDWCSGKVWATRQDEAGNWQTSAFMETGRQISSFGEDDSGELYLVDYGGSILNLQAAE
jgi:glucose/arabinose dehydrogenase